MQLVHIQCGTHRCIRMASGAVRNIKCDMRRRCEIGSETLVRSEDAKRFVARMQNQPTGFCEAKAETWIDGTAGGLVSVGAYVLVAWTYEFPALSLPARHRTDLEPA